MVHFPYERPVVKEILDGLGMKKQFIHILIGPRQVGKTTAALQIAGKWHGPVVYGSADSPLPPGPEWITAQWDRAWYELKKGQGVPVLLILDEVQKVTGWGEAVKALWDRQWRENGRIRLVLLGSSSLLIQRGLTESLAGRFLLYRCSHWGFKEMRQAFSWDLDKWLFFGGYPGAAELMENEVIWSRYIMDSIIEPVLARDVLQLQVITKPALLRHLFMLSASHPAQILSYNKMLGQLQDAGNTTTLAHYLRLLGSAFLVTGLELFRPGRRQKRGSSPKLIILNNALVNALSGSGFEQGRKDYSWWGRLMENAVGAHLVNYLSGFPYSVYYWRHRGKEVDFVVKSPKGVWALEVKSGKPSNPKWAAEFLKTHPGARLMVVGAGEWI